MQMMTATAYQTVFARNLLRGSHRRNVFRCKPRFFESNKPTYYILDHGDISRFEDYFMQMLTVTGIKWFIRLVQFLHTLSNISAGISRINALMLSSTESGLSV